MLIWPARQDGDAYCAEVAVVICQMPVEALGRRHVLTSKATEADNYEAEVQKRAFDYDSKDPYRCRRLRPAGPRQPRDSRPSVI